MFMKYLIFALELLAFITGLLAWKNSRPAPIRAITVLLFFTVLVEGYSQLFRTPEYLRHVVLIYNIYSFIEMGCWFYFFYRLFPSAGRRKVILFLGISYLAFAVVELYTYHPWRYNFHNDSYRLYSIYIIALSVLYLWDIILRKDYYPLRNDAVFWLCAGTLIFQAVFFVHLTVINIPSFRKDAGSILAFNQLLDIANLLYYCVLCVAFFISWRFVRSGS